MDENTPHEWPERSGAVHATWNQIAGFWDDAFGDGNAFHNTLVAPAVERLLALRPGEQVLDVACGNGAFARRMASLGAQVTACDVSEVFLERARAHPTPAAGSITYHLVDATDRQALLALGVGRFDAVVCNMALMDMPAIEPLFDCAARLLAPGGRMVFTLMHPCFNSPFTTKLVAEEDRDDEIVVTHALQQNGYLRSTPRQGIGIIGQPVSQTYFHRPLSVLLQSAFRFGLVMDGCEEPTFPAGAEGKRPLAWEFFPDFPPVFAARLRTT